MKSITKNIAAITRIMHATPPGGGVAVFFALPRAGLNFAGLYFATARDSSIRRRE